VEKVIPSGSALAPKIPTPIVRNAQYVKARAMELRIALAPAEDNLSHLIKAKEKAKVGAKGKVWAGAKEAKVREARANTFMGRGPVVCRQWMVSGIVQRSGKHGHSNSSQPPARTNIIHKDSNKQSSSHRVR